LQGINKYDSKRDEDDTTVNTIRKNMKDMTTADKSSIHSSQEDVTIEEEDEEEEQEQDVLAKFGGKNNNDDDWGEFAEEEEEPEEKKPEEKEKPKYTFGATSGFGTKGWAATHQTIPNTSIVKVKIYIIHVGIHNNTLFYSLHLVVFLLVQVLVHSSQQYQ
jgi:cation transport ATPase